MNGLRLTLDKYDFIRRFRLRDPNFKGYFYAKSIVSISIKSQRYYAGQRQRFFSVLLILETFITPPLRPTFLLNTFSMDFKFFSIQPLIEILFMTGKD
jgi:hypothetical protein